ncbi:MAG: DUF177 domain-containing protein [Desulfuromonadaceae bacterium]|nr:DUF177 domain-containing protein [Desulfuromonadaceae bacterium]
MQVSVDEIGATGLDLDFTYSPEDLPVLAQLQEDATIVETTPVVCHVHLHKIAQIVEVDGDAKVTVQMQCSRCLEEQHIELKVSFHQSYVEELPQVKDEDGGELELSAEQMGLELFDGKQIDLRDEIQQQIVLALPIRPLCSEKCKGLCSECGVNLNVDRCSCRNGNISMHFATLRDFKVEK